MRVSGIDAEAMAFSFSSDMRIGQVPRENWRAPRRTALDTAYQGLTGRVENYICARSGKSASRLPEKEVPAFPANGKLNV